VIDRVIQQAVLQRLQPLWDSTFSEHSYGFRPGRSAHQAVAQAQAYVIEGYRFVVDDRHFKTSGCGSIYRSRMSQLSVPHPRINAKCHRANAAVVDSCTNAHQHKRRSAVFSWEDSVEYDRKDKQAADHHDLVEAAHPRYV